MNYCMSSGRHGAIGTVKDHLHRIVFDPITFFYPSKITVRLGSVKDQIQKGVSVYWPDCLIWNVLGSVHSSHLPFIVNQVGYERSSLPILLHVGLMAASNTEFPAPKVTEVVFISACLRSLGNNANQASLSA